MEEPRPARKRARRKAPQADTAVPLEPDTAVGATATAPDSPGTQAAHVAVAPAIAPVSHVTPAAPVAVTRAADPAAVIPADPVAVTTVAETSNIKFRQWWESLLTHGTSKPGSGVVQPMVSCTLASGSDAAAPQPSAIPIWHQNVRRQKRGISAIGFAPKGGRRSKCVVCEKDIMPERIRFSYWWSNSRPNAYVHSHCLRCVDLEDEAIAADLRALEPPFGPLRDCVSEWLHNIAPLDL